MIPYYLIQKSFGSLDKISRYYLYRCKGLSILNEFVRIYRELTTKMYHVRTHIFPQLLMLLTQKMHSTITQSIYTFQYFLVRIPWKLLFLYASLEIAENPRNQPYHLYVYIPICLQFDKILCNFFSKIIKP